ncbi:MAG TPA: hypothetical protein VGR00_11335, partial [Thermoanaerobaculia bacterium]|nr:hypothetical protein [Thermoanaerobaculia bacterium]
MPTPNLIRRLLLAAIVAAAEHAPAATHLWVGPAGGNWSTPANWVGMAPPTSGEMGGTVVVFVSGSSSVANIAGLVVDQIAFTGSGNTINATTPLTLATGDTSPTIADANGGNTIADTVSLVLAGSAAGDVEITNSGNGVLTIAADVSGTPGNKLRLSGNISLQGTNSYSGVTFVSAGLLTLDSPTVDGAIPGSLSI